MNSGNYVARHGSLPRQVGAALVAGALLLTLGIGDATAQNRKGGAAARGGNGGQMAHSSVSSANRSMGASSANRGNVNRGNVNTGNVNTGNVNRGNVNTGNINTGNINTGNVNVGNDVNINIDNNYGYHGGYYHGNVRYPVAAGVVIGAMAVTTAAVIGSYYYALPPGCTVVVRAGVSYHYCGSVYYQKTWSGNDVVYVVVKL